MKRGRAATVLLLVLVSVASAWAGYAGGSMAPPAGGKPLVLVASIRALLADWQHSIPRRRRQAAPVPSGPEGRAIPTRRIWNQPEPVRHRRR